MKDRIRNFPWVGLFVVAGAVLVCAVFVRLTYTPAGVIPLVPLKPDCRTQVGLPYDVVVCPDTHAYHIEGGRWVDMGRVSPVPKVPRNRGTALSTLHDGQYSWQLSALAKRYSGSKGHPVYCDVEPRGNDGWTDLKQISLNREFCKPLLALLGGVLVAPAKQGIGLLTLMHEATHIRWPWASEAQVECFAYRRIGHAVRQLTKVKEWQRQLIAYARADSLNLQRTDRRYRSRCPL
jgi:hypothetical protein